MRKGADRKDLIDRLDQIQLGRDSDKNRCSLGQTVKKSGSNNAKKSREKTLKMTMTPNHHRESSSINNLKSVKYPLERSKEGRDSRESLMRSTHSYYISQLRNKRSESTASKHMKSHKSREIPNNSQIANSTFEMQSFISTHKKKKSNYSSTIGSKFDLAQLHRSADEHPDSGSRPKTSMQELLLKSGNVLEHYRVKYQALEAENKKYKKKYHEAMKKIKVLQGKN